MATNPRWKSGRRRKYRARLKAQDAPCHICRGRLGRIHYEEPSDARHPLSFVVDEVIPVSRAQYFGYNSRSEAADDWDNVRAAHWICNQLKRDKVNYQFNYADAVRAMGRQGTKDDEAKPKKRQNIVLDGEW